MISWSGETILISFDYLRRIYFDVWHIGVIFCINITQLETLTMYSNTDDPVLSIICKLVEPIDQSYSLGIHLRIRLTNGTKMSDRIQWYLFSSKLSIIIDGYHSYQPNTCMRFWVTISPQLYHTNYMYNEKEFHMLTNLVLLIVFNIQTLVLRIFNGGGGSLFDIFKSIFHKAVNLF